MIELHPAYVWDCPECGRENFERGCVPEMSSEEYDELRDEHGVNQFDAGHFVLMPEVVTCRECGHSEKAEHME